MKRKILLTTIMVGLLSLIVYFVPIIVASMKARPLYGNFDIEMKCMGGHEIFIYLGEYEAFQHCPGHRDMDPMGRIERHEGYVIIHDKMDDTPWIRVFLEGSDHSIIFLDKTSSHELPQVNNPWRTWLPKILPGH